MSASNERCDLRSFLSIEDTDFFIRNNGDQIYLSELEGKTVGVFFCNVLDQEDIDFPAMILILDFYNKLKEKGENFEIVMIYLFEDTEDELKASYLNIPLLALPFELKRAQTLLFCKCIPSLPSLHVFGPDGKSLIFDALELIKDHGVAAYPFSQEKIAEVEKAKLESLTLESIMVSREKDFLIDKSGLKEPVSQLVGKHVLIYFKSLMHSYSGFTKKLTKIYHEIKANGNAFEIIYVTTHRDECSFDNDYLEMPWLALPFGDKRRHTLCRMFKVNDESIIVAVGPDGKIITVDTIPLIEAYGADGFPFTQDRIKYIKDHTESFAGETEV